MGRVEYLGKYPPGQVHPPSRYTRRACTHPPGRYTPWQVHPQAGTPPSRYIPRQVHPPGRYTPRQVHPPGRYTPWQVQSPGQVHPPRAGTPPPHPMVNARAVRILSECSLVYVFLYLFGSHILQNFKTSLNCFTFFAENAEDSMRWTKCF